MKFRYAGSNALPHIAVGALFEADKVTVVRDPAAIGWLRGHAEYIEVPDEIEAVEPELIDPAPTPKPKKARKAKK